jgi:hypothetical protein
MIRIDARIVRLGISRGCDAYRPGPRPDSRVHSCLRLAWIGVRWKNAPAGNHAARCLPIPDAGSSPEPDGKTCRRRASSGWDTSFVQRGRAFIARSIRAAKLVLGDGRIPRPIRWGGALGLLPVPGPFDEAVLLLVGGILWLFYRDRLTDAWKRAALP